MADRNLVYNSTSKDLPEDVFPKGRLRFSYRTRSRAKAEHYKTETINPLREQGEYDILRAVQQQVFGIDEVHRALHDGRWSDGLKQLRQRIRTEGPDAAPTYEEAVEMYLQGYSSRRTPGTRHSHEVTLKPFGREKLHEADCPHAQGDNGDRDGEEDCACPKVNELRIDSISEFDLQQVLEGLDVASGTKETYRRKLSGFYSWHIKREKAQAETKGQARHISYNPAAEAERYRTGGEVTTLDDHQIAAVLAAARPWERAPFLLGAQLGLRAKEIIHLRKGTDLDLDRLEVEIQPRGPDPDHLCPDCQGDEGWWPKRPRDYEQKSRDEINSIRTLHIPEEKEGLIRALREHARLWPVEEGDYFFQNPSPNSNGPWTYEALRSRFQKACEATDVVPYGQKTRGGVTLHSLRHTCATEMIRAGVPLSVAAKVLGHTVDQLTTTYSHLLASDTKIGLRAVPDYDLVSPANEGADEADV